MSTPPKPRSSHPSVTGKAEMPFGLDQLLGTPAPKLNAYIVSYDLGQAPMGYLPLFTELKSSPSWWHYLTSTWVILRYEDINALHDKLSTKIYTTDRILVLPAVGPACGYLPAEAWTWINAALKTTPRG